MANRKYIIEVDAQTGNFEKKINTAKKEVGELSGEAKGVSSSFSSLSGAADRASGGLVSMARSGIDGIKGLTLGFKTLRAAIIGTGIGALVIAIVSVIQAISRLQGVQDKYKQFTAGLSAVLDVLGDTLAYIGEAIINAFTNPQEALDSFLDGVRGVVDWMKELNTVIIGSVYKALLSIKEGFLNAAIATKEFFGGDATELRAELQKTQDKIVEVEKAVSEAADGVKQPFIDAAEAVGEYVDQLAEAANKAAALEEAEQRLEDLRIAQTETQARRNKQIAEARLLVEDETVAVKDRIEALKEAQRLEEEQLNERLANAREEARIIAQRNALSESSREDRKEEAEARARVLELETASLKQQKTLAAEMKRLINEEQRLKSEAAAAEQKRLEEERKAAEERLAAQQKYAQERQAVEDELFAALNEATLTQAEKEILAVEDKYNKLLDKAAQYGLDVVELERARDAEIEALNEAARQREAEADQAELDRKRQENQMKVDLAMQAAAALVGLIDAFDGEGEQAARRQFNLNKALGIAEAVVNTSRAITAQLAVPQDALTGANFVKAGIAAATGAAQIAKIASTQFQSGGGGGGGVAGVPNIANQSFAAGVPNVGTQEPGVVQQPIQAYVVQKTLTDAQSQTQKINEQASLVL